MRWYNDWLLRLALCTILVMMSHSRLSAPIYCTAAIGLARGLSRVPGILAFPGKATATPCMRSALPE
jgi:hypothetical protein